MNKTVLITGASKGIGKALALKFKREGYSVLGTYLTSSESAEELKSSGIDMLMANVSDFNQLEMVFSYAKNKYNKIDVVINNAGVSIRPKFILDVLEKDFDDVIAVNLKGVFNGTKLAVNSMLNSGGTVVNISSIFAVRGGSCEAVYSASKAGVLAFSRAVSEELSNSSVCVCSVILGLIDTEMNSHLSNEEKLDFIKSTGLKNIPTPNFVANKIFKIVNTQDVNGKVFKIGVGKI